MACCNHSRTWLRASGSARLSRITQSVDSRNELRVGFSLDPAPMTFSAVTAASCKGSGANAKGKPEDSKKALMSMGELGDWPTTTEWHIGDRRRGHNDNTSALGDKASQKLHTLQKYWKRFSLVRSVIDGQRPHMFEKCVVGRAVGCLGSYLCLWLSVLSCPCPTCFCLLLRLPICHAVSLFCQKTSLC